MPGRPVNLPSYYGFCNMIAYGSLAHVLLGLGLLGGLLSTPRGCASADDGARAQPATDWAPPYRLDAPAAVLTLDDALDEISGLTVLDDSTLGAVQDEKGRLYRLDARTGAVRSRTRFAGDGDFEALARVGDAVYALRSDGRLYSVSDWRSDDPETDKRRTGLSRRYDTEGLAYDPAGDRLLIACKEYAGKGLSGHRAVYAYDLATETLSDAPVVLLDLDAVAAALGGGRSATDVKPAGLAVDPHSGDLYFVSSDWSALIVTDGAGVLRGAWPLDADLLPQPEAIAFLPGGDLLVATEGRGRSPTLVRFALVPHS